MADMTVSTTILQQLGGSRFVAMTGAKNLVGSSKDLMFRLPARFAKDGINAVRVELTPADTYTVKFLKVAKFGEFKVIAEFDDIYADQLQDVFTRTTGLATRL